MKSIIDDKNLEKNLLEVIEFLETKAEFADILVDDDSEMDLTEDDKNTSFHDVSTKGLKMRIFDGQKFIETHTTDFSQGNLKKIAEELAANITNIIEPNMRKNSDNGKNKENKKNIKSAAASKNKKIVRKSFLEKGNIDPDTIKIKEKKDMLDLIIDKIKKSSKKIISARTFYSEDRENKLYVSSGKILRQKLIKTNIVMIAFVKTKDDETRYAYRSIVKNGFEIKKEIENEIKELAKDALNMLNAKKIKSGKYTAILSPDLSGLLAHESFGHGMESDTVYNGRAMAQKYIGKNIAPKFVSIVDYPNISGKHGTYFFDDEGNIVKKTYLVKNGIVRDYINEGYSSKMMNLTPSGNSRCESFDHKNYARMSNTYFERGKDNFKDMIHSVKDGIFLSKASGGMEDPKSWGVQLQGIFAQRIKNGKLIDEYYADVGVTGYLPTILSNIKKVSHEFEIEGGGKCGKGHKEWVPVSSGGPYLLIENLELS